MNLTFQQALSKLDLAGAFPVDLDSTGRKAMLNEALEAIILSGRWNGTEANISISLNSDGIFTLPRQFLTCKGVRVNGSVRPLASPWYNYLEGTSDLSQWSVNVQDQGDGFCIFKQPSEAAKLRIACVGETATVEVHGTDADGADVYTGSQFGTLLTFNAVKAAPYFTNVTAVVKPVTGRVATLYACYDDSTEEAIGIYAPGETVPSYRRYLVQEAQITDDATAVVAFVQRRHVEMVADNDILFTGNVRALKNAVAHIHWENEGDETRSAKHLSNAVDWLNKELKLLRPPSEVGVIRVNARGFGASGLFSRR